MTIVVNIKCISLQVVSVSIFRTIEKQCSLAALFAGKAKNAWTRIRRFAYIRSADPIYLILYIAAQKLSTLGKLSSSEVDCFCLQFFQPLYELQLWQFIGEANGNIGKVKGNCNYKLVTRN